VSHQTKGLGPLASLVFSVVLFSLGIGQTVAVGADDATTEARQDRPRQVLRHDAAAVLKLVPVRVLDAEGRPVRGLAKEDFVLTDNGELKAITEFEVYESGETRVAAEQAAGPDVRPEARRKFFFVLDMQATKPAANKDAQNAVLEYVDNQLEPGDEAGVLTFGAYTGLVLRQHLTSDVDKIKKAIRRAYEMFGLTGQLARDLRVTVEDLPMRGGAGEGPRPGAMGGEGVSEIAASLSDVPFGGGGGGIILDTAGGGYYSRTARSTADFDKSMMELATAMKYTPGTKSVVYFSTRTPSKAASRLFAEANTTIYAVNTNVGRGSRDIRMKEAQGEALRAFAEASGGHYFADVKDARAIAREVEALSGTYYVLGYYINPAWDGRLHRIKVEVQQPDLRVLAQEAYNDPKPFSEFSDLEKQLHLFDLAFSDRPATYDALPLPVDVLFGSAMKEANTAVLMKLEVDEKIGVPPGTAEVFTLVYDKDHKIVVAEHGEIDTAPHDRRTVYPYLLTSLKPGAYEVRVLARDKETGLAVFSRLPVTAPAPAAASRLSLASPFLMVPGKKADYIRMSRPLKKRQQLMSLIRFYPYLPVNAVPLVGDLPPDARALWALLPIDGRSGEAAADGLEVKLVKAEGTDAMPVEWGLIDTKHAAAGKDFLLIGMNVAGLGPGSYRLEFTLTDDKGCATASCALAVATR
jgi:VWFA-related protein